MVNIWTIWDDFSVFPPSTLQKENIRSIPYLRSTIAPKSIWQKHVKKTSKVSITFPSSSWCILKKRVKLHSRQKNRWRYAMCLNRQVANHSRPSGQTNESSNNSNDKTYLSIMGWLLQKLLQNKGFYNLYPNQNMMFKPYPKTTSNNHINPWFFGFFSSLFINPSWNLHTPHSNQSSHIFHISVDRHSRHLYLESTSRSRPKNFSGLPQELLREFPGRDDKNHFCLHIVNIIYI